MAKSKKIVVKYLVYESVDELDSMRQKLVDKAKKAGKNAYAPYSNFHVGAAVRLENGEIILGNNQENAAFPSGLCAERVAIFAAHANYPNEKITHLAITSEGDFIDKNAILSPCGACRQVLVESSQRQKNPFEVILLNPDASVLVFDDARDLMPLIFDGSTE